MSVEIDRSTEIVRVAQNKARARANGLPATLTLEEWLDIIERFNGMCAYCEEHIFETLDHLIPLAALGGTVADNCLPACSWCNALKSGEIICDLDVALPLEAKVEQVRTILRIRAKLRKAKTGDKVLKMGRPRRTSLGSQSVHWSLTNEVIIAMNQVIDENNQGETISHFVDSWLRKNPQVKAELEQEKGKPS